MSRPTGRTFAQIDVDLWTRMADHDLSRDARQLFPFLLAQKKLSMAGALDLRVKVWATATLMSRDELEHALGELEEIGWIAVDWDTDELVIPGYARRLQITNSKNVKGMWRAWDRIESTDLRQVVTDNLPDDCPTHAAALDPAPKQPDPTPNRPTDRPIHRPIEGPTDQGTDPTGYLIPDTETTPSSSSAPAVVDNATPIPVDNPDDDEIDHQNTPEGRAQLACLLIGTDDAERAATDGQRIRNHTRFLAACQATALDTWHAAALTAATADPAASPRQLADQVRDQLAAGDELDAYDLGPRARAPDPAEHRIELTDGPDGRPVASLIPLDQTRTA